MLIFVSKLYITISPDILILQQIKFKYCLKISPQSDLKIIDATDTLLLLP
jgi:hypothetical protein